MREQRLRQYVKIVGTKQLDYIARGKLMDGYASMLNNYIFDFWITLNFCAELAMSLTPLQAAAYIRKALIENYLFKVEPSLTISYMLVIEAFMLGGLHAHMMLGGCWSVKMAEIGIAWREANHETKTLMVKNGKLPSDALAGSAGYSVIRPYDYSLGAGGYLVKYVVSSVCEWDFQLKVAHRWDNDQAYLLMPRSERRRVDVMLSKMNDREADLREIKSS
jgi:hypothetical protein